MKHITEEEIIEYLESGQITEEGLEHLRDCDQCQKMKQEYEQILSVMSADLNKPVPDYVQMDIAKAIGREITREKEHPQLKNWHVAAAVGLLILGFVTGKLSVNDRSDEILALQSQVDVLKEVSIMNALKTSTASERLQVVNQIETRTSKSSAKLLSSLFQTLDTDESPNVRYAAAQALARFMDEDDVRIRMAESLERQTDPLIQISLISILTEAQEKHAIKPIKKILDQDSINSEVKKQAQIALKILT